MDSKDLDVKMKIRRIINTPGISDRTIIGKIQGDKGVGKLINTLNQKLEEEVKDEEKITTIKLVNPVKVTNPNVTIYDVSNSDFIDNLIDYGKLAYIECDNKKIKVNSIRPGCLYSEIKCTVNDDCFDNIYSTFTNLLTELTLSTTIFVNPRDNYSRLVDIYLTEKELDAIYEELNEKDKIVAIKNIEKHPLLTNEYCMSSGIYQIFEDVEISKDRMSAVIYSLLDPEKIVGKCPPTLILDGSKLGIDSNLVLEGSTVSSSPRKIIFKPIYTSNNIYYPVMTYIEVDEGTDDVYKWSLEITIKAYS